MARQALAATAFAVERMGDATSTGEMREVGGLVEQYLCRKSFPVCLFNDNVHHGFLFFHGCIVAMVDRGRTVIEEGKKP